MVEEDWYRSDRCRTRAVAEEPSVAEHNRPAGVKISRVEDGRGGFALKSSLRFPSPLIKPDVLISSIRLSDRRHRTTHGGRPLCARIRCRTVSSLNTSPKENREVPRLLTLCRLQRMFRTRS